MSAMPDRTPAGDAATSIVLRTFRASDLFLGAGDLLAAEEGLTAARWQVLGALALAGRRLTVPQIARRMNLTRQAVQATVNRLLREELLQADENPDHRRSPLVGMTALGHARYAALQERQAAWVNELAAGLKPADLATTARVLQELCNRLDGAPRAGRPTQGGPDARRQLPES